MSEKTAKEARRAEKLRGWKIDIRSYEVEMPVFNSEGRPVMVDGKPAMQYDALSVRDNLSSMLFHAELRQGPEEMFKAKDLADKIRAAEDYVLIDKTELDRINASYKLLKGLPEHFLPFLMRIRDAEEVSLKEDESPA